MTIVCITNSMQDTRSCTVKGQHTVACDGHEYRWSERRDARERTGRPCRGCRPRLAAFGCGHLCRGCWERVENALADWEPLDRVLGTIDRAVQRDNGGISAGTLGYVPIPATQLAVDEVRSYLRSFPGTVEGWASSAASAMQAVRFARAVESAVRTHAIEEKAHRIARTRCPNCKQQALVWHPTPVFGAQVSVACSNCGHDLDQSAFEKVAAIEKPCCRRCRSEEGCTNPGCACHDAAVLEEDWVPDAVTEQLLEPESEAHSVLLDELGLTVATRNPYADEPAERKEHE